MATLRNRLTGNVFKTKYPLASYFGAANKDSDGKPIFEKVKAGKRRTDGLPPMHKKTLAHKVTRAKRNPTFGKRKTPNHSRPCIIEAVRLGAQRQISFWYWNGHAMENKQTHAFQFPNHRAAMEKAKEIRNRLPTGMKTLRVIYQ